MEFPERWLEVESLKAKKTFHREAQPEDKQTG